MQLVIAVLGSGLLTVVLNRIFAIRDRKRDANETVLAKLADLDKKIEAHIGEYERYRADLARTRILRFADELRRDIKHSPESFDNALADIDFYTDYCTTHADTYINCKAEAAMSYTKDVYGRCCRGELDFL